MKKILITLFLLIAIQQEISAQSPTFIYNFYRGFLIGEGYTITNDLSCNLKLNESYTFTRDFNGGYDYKVFGFSTEEFSHDLDIFLYHADGSNQLYKQDIDDDETPWITFSPRQNTRLIVKLKNRKSDYPNTRSKCYLFIAYKLSE